MTTATLAPRPTAVVIASLLNGIAAQALVYLLATGAIEILVPGVIPRWLTGVVASVWICGVVGLWRGDRWGWYVTVVSAVLVAGAVSSLALGPIVFERAPPARIVFEGEAVAVAVLALLPWTTALSLLHPRVILWGMQRRGDRAHERLSAGRVSRQLRIVLVLALLPATWLAAQPGLVHRSRLDSRESWQTSNYLPARGLALPWIVSAVPPDLAHVPLVNRLFPLNLVALYLIGLVPLVAIWVITLIMRAALRR